MAEKRSVTLSAEANTAVERIAQRLKISPDEALGRAIWTQDTIIEEAQAGKSITISRDGTTLQIKSPA